MPFEKDYILILYENMPLVVVKYDPFRLVKDMLTQYAEDYAFDRKKLSYAIVPMVELKAPPVSDPFFKKIP